MEEQKTKIFFITTINASLLEKNRFYFDLNGKILSDIQIKSTKIDDISSKTKKYFIYLNEFDVDSSLIKKKMMNI